jgi:2-polyprenyl-3-methyl-5-hydroxy-6-metoxy-1,4-benzoquinol methylase
MKVSKEIVGIDNAKNEIEYLKREYKINNIFAGDVENCEKWTLQPFDVIIAGALIEHLSNIGFFFGRHKRTLF